VCGRDLGEKTTDEWAMEERGDADAWAEARCGLVSNGWHGSVSWIRSGKERNSNSEIDLIIFHYTKKELNRKK
jgi:hypothetical protein